MERKYLVVPGLIVLLTITIFIAGCSDTSTSTSSAESGVTGTITPAASTGPLYTAGDILKNPKSGSGIGILIVSYDATTDTYQRALIDISQQRRELGVPGGFPDRCREQGDG